MPSQSYDERRLRISTRAVPLHYMILGPIGEIGAKKLQRLSIFWGLVHRFN